MIDKNTKLVDLTRLSEFKDCCDQTYAKKGEGGSFNPDSAPVYVTDDDCTAEEVLAVINATTTE